MTDNKYDNFIKKAKDLVSKSRKLSTEEKTLMKESVFKYVKDNPIEKQDFAKGYEMFKLSLFMRMAVPALAVVLLFGGAGISAAAEGSLPGDFLYSVKIGFTEKIRGVFAFSDNAKDKWEVRKVERRIEEAEALAKMGREDRLAFVEEKINENIDKLEERAVGLKEDRREKIYLALGEAINRIEEKNRTMLQEKGESMAMMLPEGAPAREMEVEDGTDDSQTKVSFDTSDEGYLNTPEIHSGEAQTGVGGSIEAETAVEALSPVYREEHSESRSRFSIKNKDRILARAKIAFLSKILREEDLGEHKEKLEELKDKIETSFETGNYRSLNGYFDEAREIFEELGLTVDF